MTVAAFPSRLLCPGLVNILHTGDPELLLTILSTFPQIYYFFSICRESIFSLFPHVFPRLRFVLSFPFAHASNTNPTRLIQSAQWIVPLLPSLLHKPPSFNSSRKITFFSSVPRISNAHLLLPLPDTRPLQSALPLSLSLEVPINLFFLDLPGRLAMIRSRVRLSQRTGPWRQGESFPEDEPICRLSSACHL